MSSTTEDIFQRLETAIVEWSAEVKSSTSGIAEQLTRARNRLGESSGQAGALESIGASLDFARAEFARLEAALRECHNAARHASNRAGAVEDSMAGLREDLDTLRSEAMEALRERPVAPETPPRDEALLAEVESLKAEVGRLSALADESARQEYDAPQRDEALAAEVKTVKEELRQVRELTVRVEELDGRLAVERDRADRLEQQLGEASPIARDPAPSLDYSEDLEALRHELERVRAEIDQVRSSPSPATATATDPQVSRLDAMELSLAGFDHDGRRRRMGDILRDAGALTDEQLEAALQMQKEQPQRRLGAILVELGHAESEVIAQVLACQLKLPFVRLEREVPQEEAVRLVNGRLASHHRCVPVRIEGDTVILAMANPLDLIAIEDMELATSRRVNPVVAGEEDIAKAIEWFYGSDS